FALGDTAVKCAASDHAGNSVDGTFTVRVQDTTAPVIGSLTGLVAEAAGPNGVAVSYEIPAAHDVVDPHPSIACSPGSGVTFHLGDNTVTCTATDGAGNQATSTFTVTVTDTTAPMLTVPKDLTVEATGPNGALATWEASAIDLVDGTVPVSCN